MTTDHPNPSKPRRRWFQYSLRTLLVLLTVLCVWLGLVSERARKQRKAVAWIEELGGVVRYDYEIEYLYPSRLAGTKGSKHFEEPPGPKWLRELIGDEYFVSVSEVHLIEPQVTDAGLVHLKGLNNLKRLFLNNTGVNHCQAEERGPCPACPPTIQKVT